MFIELKFDDEIVDIFSEMDDYANEEDWGAIDDVLENIDVKSTDIDSLIAYLMATSSIPRELLRNRANLYTHARIKLTKELGEEETSDILDRLK